MDCDAAMVAISARVDGEPAATDVADGALDRHLATCRSCARWEERSYALRRTMILRRPEVPDGLSARILANVSVPQTGAGEWVRYALGVVAAAIVILNIPLLLGLSSSGPVHDLRHLGTFGVALGVGLFWAAVRPERAIGLVPLAAALGVALLVGSLADLGRREATLLEESTHLLEYAGLGLLWYLSGGLARFRRNRRSLGSRTAALWSQ